MKRSLLVLSSAIGLAIAAPAPLLAQSVESEALTQDDADAFASIMGNLFAEAEALTPEEEARLPIAQKVVGKLFPEGTYAKMMQESMQPMMQGIMGGIEGNPAITLSQLTGVGVSDLQQLNSADLEAAVQLLDPSASDRSAAMGEISVKMVTDVMKQIEPAYRVGLVRAYATRFTQEELTELDGFFSTKTGGRYAAESFLIYADPQVMAAMNDMMPAMIEMMPKMMEGMAKVSEQFPPARRFSELSAQERDRVARLLGKSVPELDALEPQIEVETNEYTVEAATE